MAKPTPKTKAGKERKVAKTMDEFKQGELKSSSGETVTNPKQAIAISLSQTGQSKPPSERKGTGNASLAKRLSQRIDERSGGR
jgi:Family of unknown function (DUF6496)